MLSARKDLALEGKWGQPTGPSDIGLLGIPITRGLWPEPLLLNTGPWTSSNTKPENLLEMQTCKPLPGPSRLETLAVGPRGVCLQKPQVVQTHAQGSPVVTDVQKT